MATRRRSHCAWRWARCRPVLRLLFGRVVAQVMLGLALGVAGAYALGRVLQGMLVQTSPTHQQVLATAGVVLLECCECALVPRGRRQRASIAVVPVRKSQRLRHSEDAAGAILAPGKVEAQVGSRAFVEQENAARRPPTAPPSRALLRSDRWTRVVIVGGDKTEQPLRTSGPRYSASPYTWRFTTVAADLPDGHDRCGHRTAPRPSSRLV